MTELEQRWKNALLSLNATILEAIECLNKVGIKIVLCVHEDGRIYGAVSDGDLRRGLLHGLSMDDPLYKLANVSPLVVPPGTKVNVVRALMQSNKIHQVPIVDDRGVPVGLHLWDEIDSPPLRPNTMVIMAGGKGTRLRPYTENCPKPMLPIAGKPMLQHIIERARGCGFSTFIISLNYLGHIIQGHFGDGSNFGVQISYVLENQPLGTAGALSLLPSVPDLPFIVSNGDVLTEIDYGELLDFRQQHNASAVMAVRSYEIVNPFGVVKLEGIDIKGFEEKPVIRSFINAGIYALDPMVLTKLQVDQHCDMPTLFDRLQQQEQRTIAFPLHEPWLDVGRPDDLEKAQTSITTNRT